MHVRSRGPIKSPLFLLPALCAAILLAVLIPGTGFASAPPSGSLIFILDASGSMGAKIQGKIKMDVAKEALIGLIRDLPAGIGVGLVAYGHRQKSDCNDVEELAPLGPLNKEALIARVKSIGFKGMTPIASSVRKVAEGLKTLEGEATIVLVSDGEETCGGDPCALVRELKASGIKFVMHVIGFDVADKERAQLSCIAEAGGGSYFAAKNAGELGVAAQKAVQKTEQSAGKLKVTALRNGKPLKAYCRILKPAADADKEREMVDEGWIELNGTSFKLTPGVYDLEIENPEDANHPTVKFSGVTIELGKNIEKVADFSGGDLKVKALRNGKPFRAYCEVYGKGAGADEEKEKEKAAEGWIEAEGTSFKLTPGVYDVKVIDDEDAGKPTVAFAGISIDAGKSVEKTADFSGGAIRVKALRNGKPTRAYSEIYSKGGEDEEKEKEKVAEGWIEAEGTSFKLMPGVYEIRVKNEEDSNGTATVMKDVSVEAGKVVERQAEFSGGTLKVKSTRGGKHLRTYCEIYTTDTGEDKEKEKAGEGWIDSEGTSFKLITGTYDAVVQWNDNEVKKEFKGISIEAGKVQTLDAQF